MIVLVVTAVLCEVNRCGVPTQIQVSAVCSCAILGHCNCVVVCEVNIQEVIARTQLIYVHSVATVNVKEQDLVSGLFLVAHASDQYV